ncbi:CASP-like protein 1E2 [Senna tora]|uniref:CASP-like protein n=1 Tax=Senna tora TaxID=362788 RepID=A0A834T1R1_9FABA|nr:CASP-like protein 1E2 [Senna tora]
MEMMIRKASVCDFVVRIVAFALTLMAAIIVGSDKQTKLVPIKLFDSLPPLNVPLTAKSTYQSAFVGYAALSLVVEVVIRRGSSRWLLGRMIVMVDALMVGLLFSGNGAASAVGLIGLQGNSHVHWTKVCNVFTKFCDQFEVALSFSLLASLAFLFLLLRPLFTLQITH